MSKNNHIILFLDDANCKVIGIEGDNTAMFTHGITERNIQQLVDNLVARGNHVTLYRVGSPKYYGEW